MFLRVGVCHINTIGTGVHHQEGHCLHQQTESNPVFQVQPLHMRLRKVHVDTIC
jgi:hypothetical protein